MALLVSGCVMVAALAFQLWRSSTLESQLQATETERELLLGERILQRAVASRAAFAVVPAGSRLVVRSGHVVVDRGIAWLRPVPPDVDEDLIVLDRLDRAARAEFVAKDNPGAVAEFDELLNGPLLVSQRLQVLSAALWHAKRAQLADRQRDLRSKFAASLTSVTPAQLASQTIASAVASAMRFAGAESGDSASPRLLRSDKVAELLPFLPPVPFAGLQVEPDLAAKHREVTQRRDRMSLAEARLAAQPATASVGLYEVSADRVLWLLEAVDGQRQAAVLTPREWFEVLLVEAREGSSFAWPERIEPVFGPADQVAFATVPGIAKLQSRQLAALGAASWWLPALSGLLVTAFALAFVQHRRAARREVEAIATQSQFLTTVTHELKTPLAGIRLLGEMLAEGRAQGRESDYYRLLVGESARLSLLIDNVLDLGRLERGERSYSLSQVPLGDVVREALRMFAPVLEQDGLSVEFDDGLLDACATIDRDAFVQSFVAVLDNARKYAATGKQLRVVGAMQPDQLTVSVRDFGPGVLASERDTVFDRFVRGDEHQHGSTPGVGIGLYLARTIVRRLNGELTCVAPADGAGAEFRFTLQRGESS